MDFIIADKTKNMLIGNHQLWTDFILEQKIENIYGLAYLGSSIHHRCDMDQELKNSTVVSTMFQKHDLWSEVADLAASRTDWRTLSALFVSRRRSH